MRITTIVAKQMGGRTPSAQYFFGGNKIWVTVQTFEVFLSGNFIFCGLKLQKSLEGLNAYKYGPTN